MNIIITRFNMKFCSNSLKYNFNLFKYINRNIRHRTRGVLSSSLIEKSLPIDVNITNSFRKFSIRSRLLNFFNNNSNYDDQKENDPGPVEGTDLLILKYPHPKLRKDNEIINVFNNELKKIANEMLLVMYASDGIGLAAPQVGINKRLIVFNEKGLKSKKQFEMIMINPKIISKSVGTKMDEEGCLSFPDIYGKVRRHNEVNVEYHNLNGELITKKFSGYKAKIFQHEYDHLDKILFIDRLDKKDLRHDGKNKKLINKLIVEYEKTNDKESMKL